MTLYTIISDLTDSNWLSLLDTALSVCLKDCYRLFLPSEFHKFSMSRNHHVDYKHLYLLTDYDEGIQCGRSLSCPVIAWSHEENTGESLMGTPWLILSPDAISPFYLEEISARYYHYPLVVTETSRLIIRELTLEDLPDLIKMQKETGSPANGAFFPKAFTRTGTTHLMYKNYLSDYICHQYPFFGYGLYAIIQKNSGCFLGIAGYSSTKEDHSGNISYTILSPWRRQGYGKEALLPLLELGRDYWGFSRITAFISKSNTASIALARSCKISTIIDPPNIDSLP